MRLAHGLVLSTVLASVSTGCGESTPPPAAASTAASTAAVAPDAKKGPTSKGKQTFQKRREYSAADPEGPPSKY
ncbi:MAG: hypothetical protein P4L85_26955 [Paludisphaera borealis]|uniref:hypothetical protein n=1 Tax=Paludisphaera borealis TaxID=1387353 RepID=UPI002844AC83|nr:hypothetical protein [Paludisphaera borealis]MDR3623021.1 hypothetical protein [Paludisphaera borealis]